MSYVHAIMADSVGALREGASSDSPNVAGPLERRSQRRIQELVQLHPHSDRAMIRSAISGGWLVVGGWRAVCGCV